MNSELRCSSCKQVVPALHIDRCAECWHGEFEAASQIAQKYHTKLFGVGGTVYNKDGSINIDGLIGFWTDTCHRINEKLAEVAAPAISPPKDEGKAPPSGASEAASHCCAAAHLPNRMDAPDGPRCHCGAPSAVQSGDCKHCVAARKKGAAVAGSPQPDSSGGTSAAAPASPDPLAQAQSMLQALCPLGWEAGRVPMLIQIRDLLRAAQKEREEDRVRSKQFEYQAQERGHELKHWQRASGFDDAESFDLYLGRMDLHAHAKVQQKIRDDERARLEQERDAALAREKELRAQLTADDWTVKDGRSNSSDEFERLCGEVGRIIRDSAHDLINGRSKDVGRLIMAQLAHFHGLRPAVMKCPLNLASCSNNVVQTEGEKKP